MRRTLYLLVLAVAAGCGGGGGDEIAAPPLSAEAFCGQVRDGFGKFFACLTNQANLQTTAFPDGSRGYCMPATENLGLVGYSVTTFNGGAAPVTSQATASANSQLLGNQSPGYIRCTREQ